MQWEGVCVSSMLISSVQSNCGPKHPNRVVQCECLCTGAHMALNLATILDQSQEDGDGLGDQPPRAKRCKRSGSPSYKDEVIPEAQCMTKWVKTPTGILPFVKNMETDLIHCGYIRMRMLNFPKASGVDERAIICMSGCESWESQCQGRPNRGACCECPCHILQEHYDARLPKDVPKEK